MLRRTYLKLVGYQTEQSKRHMEEVRSIYAEMRGFKHDIRHHLIALKTMLDEGDTDRAKNYLRELENDLLEIDTMLKTGNLTADATFSSKLSQAKRYNIQVTSNLVIPEKLSLSDVEVSIVFGNLLENAIEACTGLPEDKRFIRLYSAPRGKMLYFSMLNSSGGKMTKKSGMFSTTKNESGLHGFGLRRTANIIENHGGWIKFNSEDGAFSTEFLVPVEV